MTEPIQTKIDEDATQVNEGPSNESPFRWGAGTPRGAKAVFSRIIKEGANVPLFLGQTLVNALRDLGYNDTTSAICEFVDNSVQWGASTVRVYFNESGKRGQKKRLDVLVLDRLDCPLERGADQVEATEGARLELLEFLLVVDADRLGHRRDPS